MLLLDYQNVLIQNILTERFSEYALQAPSLNETTLTAPAGPGRHPCLLTRPFPTLTA